MGKDRENRRVVILVVLSFLLSTGVSLASLHIISRQNVREMNKVLATQIYDHIISELSEPIMVARAMSHDTFLADTLVREDELGDEECEETFSRYLSGIEGALGYHSTFVISNASGSYYTRIGNIRTIDTDGNDSTDAWYRDFIESNEALDLDVDYDETIKSDLAVYVNAKISTRERGLLGICGVGVRMTGIQNLFNVLEEDFNVDIALVDTTGIVEVDTDRSNIEKKDLSVLIKNADRQQYMYQERPEGFVVTKYVDNLDWYLVVQSRGTGASAYFANVILLNAILCVVVLLLMLLAFRNSRRQTEELTRVSLIDHLTGLHNRRAFEDDKGELLFTELSEDFMSVTADVNGLKTVNDTIGHDAGDELIRGAASCLKECLSPYGRVYRIGGDEFAALLHVPIDDQDALQQRLSETFSAWRGDHVAQVYVSCGFAARHEFPQENVLDLCRISDKRMYEEKNRYYERTGKTRRT